MTITNGRDLEIYFKEMERKEAEMIRRKARMASKKKPMRGKSFRSFMNSRIRFG